MEGFSASTYGDGFAEVYDRWYPDVTDRDACVAALAELAGPARAAPTDRRRVLELGVGTGRLALPLADLGFEVTGIDASAGMLEALTGKPGADRLTLVVGDMAELDLLLPRPPATDGTATTDGTGEGDRDVGFALAFAAYNTLFNLPTSEAQGRCLGAVAERLAPGGRVVVEAFVPVDDPAARRDDVAISRISATELVLTATLHDPEAQTITGQHVQFTDGQVRLRPWLVHYLRPGQLDALAASVGLELEDRWSNWERAPFDEDSPVQVAVYRRAP